jgi:hypothetical protein
MQRLCLSWRRRPSHGCASSSSDRIFRCL